ncbi:MAG: haloacid dehalogenase-like hydrolase [Peptococcaceae bacterium]|nr:haloacid dehalogenase-like hydrolase [Peptococcaceae bacterium]
MNLYDFDETIYDGDSTRDFVIYLYKRYPKLLRYLPRLVAAVVSYSLGKIEKTPFKERIFSMFASVPNIEAVVEDFWDENAHKVLPYYMRQAREDDVIISASPAFIVEPLCRRLGLTHVIASDVDPQTGIFRGENCYGKEKVRRFIEAGFSAEDVEQVYSDSLSDTPIAELGQEAFIVTKKGIKPWGPTKQSGMQALFTMFNKREALLTIAVGVLHVLSVGHATKVVTREKKTQPLLTYSILHGLNGISIVLILGLLGKKHPMAARVSHAFTNLNLPLGLTALFAMFGVLYLGGGVVTSLALATGICLVVVYKGTQLIFRKEIAEMQATQHLPKETDEA